MQFKETDTKKANPGTKVSAASHTTKQVITKAVIYAPKTVSLSKSSYTYNGKTCKPSVTIKNSSGGVIYYVRIRTYKTVSERNTTPPGLRWGR